MLCAREFNCYKGKIEIYGEQIAVRKKYWGTKKIENEIKQIYATTAEGLGYAARWTGMERRVVQCIFLQFRKEKR